MIDQVSMPTMSDHLLISLGRASSFVGAQVSRPASHEIFLDLSSSGAVTRGSSFVGAQLTVSRLRRD